MSDIQWKQRIANALAEFDPQGNTRTPYTADNIDKRHAATYRLSKERFSTGTMYFISTKSFEYPRLRAILASHGVQCDPHYHGVRVLTDNQALGLTKSGS